MQDKERKDFIINELEAIYEELDNSVNQLVLLRRFFGKLVDVSKGEEPDYDNLTKILNGPKNL